MLKGTLFSVHAQVGDGVSVLGVKYNEKGL